MFINWQISLIFSILLLFGVCKCFPTGKITDLTFLSFNPRTSFHERDSERPKESWRSVANKLSPKKRKLYVEGFPSSNLEASSSDKMSGDFRAQQFREFLMRQGLCQDDCFGLGTQFCTASGGSNSLTPSSVSSMLGKEPPPWLMTLLAGVGMGWLAGTHKPYHKLKHYKTPYYNEDAGYRMWNEFPGSDMTSFMGSSVSIPNFSQMYFPPIG